VQCFGITIFNKLSHKIKDLANEPNTLSEWFREVSTYKLFYNSAETRMELDQDSDRWLAIVITVKNLRVP
jgi:hypothetical protein